jgi:Spy/CpxP family protein refolding chaperone
MDRNAWLRTLVGMVLGVLAVGAGAVGVSYAQQPVQKRGQMATRSRGMMPAGRLGAMRRGLAQLGLSDEQKQQIRAIVEGRKAELKSFRDGMRQARRGVAKAIASDEGETAIRARSAELARTQADLAVFRAELRKQALGVLTPEQQAKAKELRLRALERAERAIQRRKKLPEL